MPICRRIRAENRGAGGRALDVSGTAQVFASEKQRELRRVIDPPVRRLDLVDEWRRLRPGANVQDCENKDENTRLPSTPAWIHECEPRKEHVEKGTDEICPPVGEGMVKR